MLKDIVGTWTWTDRGVHCAFLHTLNEAVQDYIVIGCCSTFPQNQHLLVLSETTTMMQILPFRHSY